MTSTHYRLAGVIRVIILLSSQLCGQVRLPKERSADKYTHPPMPKTQSLDHLSAPRSYFHETKTHALYRIFLSFLRFYLFSGFLSFLRFYLFIFRQRGREGERERNSNVWFPLARPLLRTWPATQACALTGNRTGSPLLRSSMLSPLSHTSEAHFWIFKNFVLMGFDSSRDLCHMTGISLPIS